MRREAMRGVLVAALLVAGTERATAQKLARTADGHPDLQGVWTHGTATPFERPPALGTKAFYTEDEAREAAEQGAARRAAAARNPRPGDVGGDNEAFVDRGYPMLPTLQTSQIVDPPDGRLPLAAAAEKQRDFNLESTADPETMSQWDRCISRGPTLMLPSGYNNGIRIVQSPGFVVIESEMIHEARVIPTDGRPHVSPRIRKWTGDPVGRWEGDTLVVDSTNYLGRGWVSTHAASQRLRGIPSSETLHIVERFTPDGTDALRYEMTVDDPSAYTRPWTVSLVLRRDPGYELYEYACHEGNAAIELVLRGARFGERQPTPP